MKRALLVWLALFVALPALAILKSAPSANVTSLGAITITGAVNYTGAAPVISACGTSPAIDAHATNSAGTVTVGSGTVSSCTVTFATSGFVTWDHCRVTPQQSIAAFAYSYTLTVLTVTATSLTSDKFDYQCDGS